MISLIYFDNGINLLLKETQKGYIVFFQRVKTCKENDWEWYFATGKFRRNDLSNTIFISQSLREIPQLVKKFENIIEEDDFYRTNYERFQTLTKREKEILAYIASGESSNLIPDK
ncbi:MAG: hypothetical protein KTR26_05880 [Flammeovirgaceae bacterium]|nr:hypothetical protein [Flammeovirgaceae bacterium]